jgi:type I restriction enzyme, S subunit
VEVRAGFKPTEAGMIPSDWFVQALGELGGFKNGINKVAEDFGHGSPFINLMDVFGIPRAAATTENLGLVNSTQAEQQTYELRAGDVLFVRSSVKPEGVGLTTLIPNDLPKTVFSGFLFRFRDRGQLARDFKEHCFLSDGFRKRLIANSTVSANTNINQGALKLLQLGFPPSHDEQCAIATALSDVDALLGGLDRLIAKKRDLKQAAVQQLLTGQTRLPGFHGEWRVKRLGEVADVKTGPFGSSLHERDYVQDGTPIITVEHLGEFGVEHSNLPLVSDFDRRRLQAYTLAIGDIVFSRVGSVDRNALIRSAEAGWLFSGRLLRVRPEKQKVYAPFLSFQFHSEPFKALVRNVAVGQTMASLNTRILEGVEVVLPPVGEQTEIASVLSDMDAELLALEARRDKTRDLKQAMMQELLTGKTRLVPAGATRA